MRIVWQTDPSAEALHKLNHKQETPFHAAIQNNNEFAIELVHGKLSLDEIKEALAKCSKMDLLLRLQDVMDEFRGCLLVSLNNDVVGLICNYLDVETHNTRVRGFSFDFEEQCLTVTNTTKKNTITG